MVIVLDCETTGLRPEAGHTVVELAAVALTPDPYPFTELSVDLAQGTGLKYRTQQTYSLAPHPFSTLVAPGRRLSPEAQAVHHLRDIDLRQAPKLPLALDQMLHHFGASRGTRLVVAAHNAAFDRAFLETFHDHFGAAQWLCTYRLACHLYPNAPGHSNQVLRYFLGLDNEVRASLPGQSLSAHRALYDAITTACLLKHMLSNRTLEDLLILQDQPVLQRVVRFGKYRGQEWAAVPRDYLAYVMRQTGPGGFDADVMHTAAFHMNRSPI
jgi:exodeoxyribonuclease X